MMNKVNLEKQTDPTYEKPMEFKTLQHRVLHYTYFAFLNRSPKGTCTGTGILLECCLFCCLKLYTMLDFWQIIGGVGWGGGDGLIKCSFTA